MSRADPARMPSQRTLPPPPLAACDAIALFVDVDGTLIDFAPRPHEVVVEPGLPATLARLRERLGGALAPLSGRPLHEIDALLQLPPAAGGGLHGAELRAADGRMLATPNARTRLDDAREHAVAALAAMPGVLLEDKGSSIALHYRNAPQAQASVRAVAQEMLARADGGYTLLHGHFVVELKPVDTHKGTALAALMRSAPFAGRTPWMIGDDITDEDAFAAANGRGGVSVIVGARRPTRAHFAFDDPAAARAWIAALAGGGGKPGARAS